MMIFGRDLIQESVVSGNLSDGSEGDEFIARG